MQHIYNAPAEKKMECWLSPSIYGKVGHFLGTPASKLPIQNTTSVGDAQIFSTADTQTNSKSVLENEEIMQQTNTSLGRSHEHEWTENENKNLKQNGSQIQLYDFI